MLKHGFPEAQGIPNPEPTGTSAHVKGAISENCEIAKQNRYTSTDSAGTLRRNYKSQLMKFQNDY